MCPCNDGQQTSDHIIFECNTVEAQRSPLIKQIMISRGSWPPAKDELITKYLKAFLSFVKSKDELITKYLKAFLSFVKSIDFQKLT